MRTPQRLAIGAMLLAGTPRKPSLSTSHKDGALQFVTEENGEIVRYRITVK